MILGNLWLVSHLLSKIREEMVATHLSLGCPGVGYLDPFSSGLGTSFGNKAGGGVLEKCKKENE